MTLIDAIKELMDKGVTDFVGWTAKAALDNAISIMETAHSVVKTGIGDVKSWQYTLDHADDNFIIEVDGHHIIATTFYTSDGKTFSMATYGDYQTEEELTKAFDEWKIAKDAGEIADDMMKKRPGELSREAWVLIVTHELRAAYEASLIAFEKEFGSEKEES